MRKCDYLNERQRTVNFSFLPKWKVQNILCHNDKDPLFDFKDEGSLPIENPKRTFFTNKGTTKDMSGRYRCDNFNNWLHVMYKSWD